MKDRILKTFLEVIAIDTKSDPSSDTFPSSKNQFDLLDYLNEKLVSLGLEVNYDTDKGYIYALLKANKERVDSVGFIAHVDTAPDLDGKCINPQVINNYDGSVVKLNEEYSLDPSDFPELEKYIGQTLITTDGTTLLGSDDKSGVVEILEAVTYFVENPKEEHGDIWAGFTTDEEIGRGALNFDVSKFKADYAYTLDGGEIGEFSYENFNAAGVSVEIQGRNVHPGSAKNQMISAAELLRDFENSLPHSQRPQYTEGSEGFYHVVSMSATVEEAKMYFIIRDHSKDKFEFKKEYAQKMFDMIVKSRAIDASIEITDQYYNMYEVVKENEKVINLPLIAMEKLDITPIVSPIRGGTDGSGLSYKGLPCPNIFAGGHNFHGRYEYVCLESMQSATDVVVEILKEVAK